MSTTTPIDSAVAALEERVRPLATVDPLASLEDVGPLATRLGRARVIGLGESTHGSSEFFRLKHRLIRALAEHHAVTVVGFESSMAECALIDRFVTTGQGDADAALLGQRYWTWDCAEVLDLITWMRAYNLERGPLLRFFGFDMQFPVAAARRALAVLARVASDEARALGRRLAVVTDEFGVDHFAQRPPEVRAEALDAARALAAAVNDVVEDPFERLIAANVVQGVEARGEMERLPTLRDAAMATNVMRFIDEVVPGARAVLWAHNGHVGRAPYQIPPWEPVRPMGAHLTDLLGEDYAVVGFATSRGTVRVLDGGAAKKAPLSQVPQDALDSVCARTESSMWWLDLADADDELGSWLATAPPERMIGAVQRGGAGDLRALDPREAYDVLVFVRETSASEGRPSPDRGPWGTGETLDAPRDLDPGDVETGAPRGWSIVWSGPPDAYEVHLATESVAVRRRPGTDSWGTARVMQRFRSAGGEVIVTACARASIADGSVHLYVSAEGTFADAPCPVDGSEARVRAAVGEGQVTVGLALAGAGEIAVESIRIEAP